MSQHVTFFVHGTPASKGSKSAVVRGGRAIMYDTSSKKLGPWQRSVRRTAEHALIGMDWKLDGPMFVELHFVFQRPKKHHVSNDRAKKLRDTSPQEHTSYPDIDKAVRSTLDALKQGGAFSDDRQVSALKASKGYCTRDPGCYITVTRAETA